MKFKNTRKSVVSLLLILVSISSYGFEPDSKGQNMVKAGRYMSVMAKPTKHQENLLNVVTTFQFSQNTKTVGEAVKLLLERSGYRLADAKSSDPYLGVLLTRPLPQVHRRFSNVSVQDALKTLATDVWDLVVDPVNRLVSFELDHVYKRSLLATQTRF